MEDYVSFKVAQSLKKKGYPQHGYTDSMYVTVSDKVYLTTALGMKIWVGRGELVRPNIHTFGDEGHYENLTLKNTLHAPTLYQVCKWLRDENDIHICPVHFNANSMDGYNLEINEKIELSYDKDGFSYTTVFKTYEDALTFGINKVLDNWEDYNEEEDLQA